MVSAGIFKTWENYVMSVAVRRIFLSAEPIASAKENRVRESFSPALAMPTTATSSAMLFEIAKILKCADTYNGYMV
jgi:hypothetical protein